MKNIFASIGLLVIITAISMQIGCISKAEESLGYRTITVGELISDTTVYDGQEILVRGRYVEGLNESSPECIPIGTGENPEIREKYAIYDACTWGISNLNGFGIIGVVVISENGAHNCTPLLE